GVPPCLFSWLSEQDRGEPSVRERSWTGRGGDAVTDGRHCNGACTHTPTPPVEGEHTHTHTPTHPHTHTHTTTHTHTHTQTHTLLKQTVMQVCVAEGEHIKGVHVGSVDLTNHT